MVKSWRSTLHAHHTIVEALLELFTLTVNIQLHVLLDSVSGMIAAAMHDLGVSLCRAGNEPGGAVKRIQHFQSIGTEARLRDMLQDMSLDVRERVTSALDNFDCAHADNDGDMSVEDPIDLLDSSVDGS